MLNEIRTRRSIRKYTESPVSEEIITQLLESAILAPSGSNTQPWHFIIVRSESTRIKIAEISHNQKWMVSAPVHIVCVADIRSRISDDIQISVNEDSPHMEVKQIIRDTSIAAEHIVLEAENLGLGACWVAWFTQEEIRPVLNIPSDKFVVCILTIGFAEEQPKARPRKKLEEITHHEIW